ncbi:hypothetical protein J6590_098424 [Homalodisca vitripennis]|nr:hypothetical protein J6590_098424 [Homalodisca vitripennis]
MFECLESEVGDKLIDKVPDEITDFNYLKKFKGEGLTSCHMVVPYLLLQERYYKIIFDTYQTCEAALEEKGFLLLNDRACCNAFDIFPDVAHKCSRLYYFRRRAAPSLIDYGVES